MKIKFELFTKRLPKGYYILVWKNAAGEERYSTFWGDDRLMSFRTRDEAVVYSIKYNKDKV